MFGNLGKGLNNLIRKLVAGTAIDKTVVEEILQDMEKILLQSDVDVKLTNEIIANIRKKCLDEKIPPGLTLREHVLKVIYEELVRFLGEKPFGLIGKKRVMLVGLFGSGKCVHPESLIPLSDGRILKAKELFDKLSEGSPQEIQEDFIIVDVSNKNVSVPSFNPETMKIENKRMTHLWKLEGNELLEVYLDNGNDFSVKVTPEHPFFVLRKGQFKQLKADELSEDDFVAIPRYFNTECSTVNFLTQLKSLDLDVKLSDVDKFKLDKSIKEIHKELPFKRNYCKLTSKIKKGIVPISLLKETKLSTVVIKHKDAIKFINFPKYLTAELAEFLGYVIGDGHLDTRYVEIVNEKPEIIARIKFLSKSLFGLEVEAERDIRTKALYRLRLNSITLVLIISRIFGISIGKKGKNLKIPQQILTSDLELIRQFIMAYFDCDASPSNNAREIELISESKILVKMLQSILLRFGILSSVSKKVINDVYYWRLCIRSKYAEIYAQKIGFRALNKQNKASKYSVIGTVQGSGKQDMIPLGKVLQDTRMSLGFSIGEIQKFVTSYGLYEDKGLISRTSLLKLCKLYRERGVGFIFKLLSTIKNSRNIYQEFPRHVINGSIHQLKKYGLIEEKENLLQLTQKGSELLDQGNRLEKLNYLGTLALSDVCWLRVQNIVRRKEVTNVLYDFTVEDTHSFIADGIIVHNTTTVGKLGKYFIKQGLKPAFIAMDYHRPAATEQLQQIGDQIGVPVYVSANKDPYHAARDALEKFSKHDVLIFDTAGRNALDAELAVELKKLNEIIKPDEILLVIPADLGKVAKQQSQEFHKLVGITGVIITKMDGTAKAGGALAATHATSAKVKFIGVGERLEDLELYDPTRFVSRLLGLGDLQTLLEKAKEVEIKKETVEKIAEGKFTLQDFYDQLKAMQNMGPLSGMMKMIPGMGMMNIPEGLLEKQEEKLKVYKFIIESMGKDEREFPEIITSKRIARIAKGSGRSEAEVRELLNQYNQMKKMMKQLGGMKGLQRGALKNLGKQFGFKF